jgi:cytochrome P450
MHSAVAGFAPSSPGFIADPYPALAELRAAGRIHHHEPTHLWLVTRHADVDAILRDRRFGRTYLHRSSHAEMGRAPEPEWQAPFWSVVRNGMLDREPPDHTRLRSLVSRAFTPGTVEASRPRIEAIVNALLERALERGTFDLLADYFEPLPVEVIADLLGIPAADRPSLRPWSADMCGLYELNASEETGRRAVAASIAFAEYLRALTRERLARPREDLLSSLAQVAEAGERLSVDEVVGTAILLLNAGHEASVNGAGNAWWTLFRHPDALAWLREDPARVPRAIEELLRYDTPLPMFERWVLEDAEIAGTRVPRGAELGLLFASANRDAAAFDAPDTLRLDRHPNPHLTFGAGIHFCLGAPLARLELKVAFEALLRRAPNLQLVEPPTWKPTFVLRGLKELRVEARS